jgi:hypothetical protein
MTQAANQPLAPAAAGTKRDGIPRNLGAARVVIGLAAPVAVGVIGVLGWLVMRSFNLGYGRELVAALIISVVAGFVAVVPMMALLGKGAIAVVRLTMVAMLVRMGLTLAGLVLAFGPGWQLDHGVLVVMTAACYVALMVAESGATIWATRH